jgi:polyphosphate kinase 2 (PPK2 family)
MSNVILSPKRHGLAEVSLKAPTTNRSDLEVQIRDLQTMMLCVQQAYAAQNRRAIVVFEGWDAAGKGGAIRRMTEVLDHRRIKIWAVGPPGPKEQGVHYLYRFWRRLPEPQNIAIFDRSWYGRVLVERVDKLISKPQWTRAYDEINEFENMLVDDGVRLVKIFLHISQKEQKKRLYERLITPYKRWKLTADDFHNRSKRKEYQAAINDMLMRTWTKQAPWHVLSGENKPAARLAVLEVVTKALSTGVDIGPLKVPDDVKRAARKAFGRLPNGV